MTTKQYYHSRRFLLIHELGGVCAACGATDDLEVHHVNNGNNHSARIGGWQQLMKLEREYVEGVPLKLLCKSCHRIEHSSCGEDCKVI